MGKRVVKLKLSDKNDIHNFIGIYLKQSYGVRIENLTDKELSKLLIGITAYSITDSPLVVDKAMDDLGYVKPRKIIKIGNDDIDRFRR